MEMLSLWYGRERASVEITDHTHQPCRIGVLVDDVLAGIRRPENGVLVTLRANWNKLVGGGFARFTEPVSLRDGVLTLKVRHSALLMELQPSLA